MLLARGQFPVVKMQASMNEDSIEEVVKLVKERLPEDRKLDKIKKSTRQPQVQTNEISYKVYLKSD